MYPVHAQTEPEDSPIRLGDIGREDLRRVNEVLAAAIGTWDLAPRVKRLALSSYRYDEHDFQDLAFVGAWREEGLAGFVSFEPADPTKSPDGQSAMLVHGLYVAPESQGVGIGSRLIDAVKQRSRRQGFAGLLVRAERNATAFFRTKGFRLLPVEDHRRDYPHRMWSSIDTR